VVGIDQMFLPDGNVAVCTTLRVPSQIFHAAVTLPLASIATGTERVIETPPGVKVANV